MERVASGPTFDIVVAAAPAERVGPARDVRQLFAPDVIVPGTAHKQVSAARPNECGQVESPPRQSLADSLTY